MAALEPNTLILALVVLGVMLILGWDIVQMDREMRGMRASFQRGAHSRQNRDGGAL